MKIIFFMKKCCPHAVTIHVTAKIAKSNENNKKQKRNNFIKKNYLF